ncbi:hypothetical protein PIB30_028248 [Stylosanthes scabra]|uniref:Formin-like protein n=1 Tax=Stylosanthes scabra TaxID=79078 RepID=A0ABU6V9U4_9FABA|nr:hypothetical protein [Stylosanthes scabra]
MALILNRILLLSLVVLFSICFLLPKCHSQTTSPQNIETFYPNETSAQPPEAAQRPEPPREAQPSQQPPVAAPRSSSSSSSNGKVAKAVAATAASTIVVCGLLFFLVQRCLKARKREEEATLTSNNNAPVAAAAGDKRVAPQGNTFERIEGNVKGLIVDEDGLDVIYWRKLEGKRSNKDLLHKQILRNKQEEEDNHVKKSKSIQETPLLRGKSSASHMNIVPEIDEPYQMTRIASPNQSNTPPPPASPSSPPPSKGNSPVPPPPPPPPPIPARKSSSKKTPPASTEMVVTSTSKRMNSSGKAAVESGNDNVKLKPLHWDKLNTNNADHSMVWDNVDRGSFRVDQDLMEALFGYVAKNRRSPKGKNPSNDTAAGSTRIFLLDSRKSQNIAIVVKSLAISRDEIIDAVTDGRGLNADTLEKLVRIAPTEEEQSLIIEYKGDPAILASAESFLFHILKSVPSAFKRLIAMLFRLNYTSEILEIKESLQVLELGCKELKSQRIFVKLLEAVLKAGNRMNAGTARGNAQAFNLASLRKLSDVKSTDGKTTLLHFVVEEVVQSEGKRISKNSGEINEKNAASEEQREREYITLGLPIVGGISSEFSNVKKAAIIDYNTLVGSISALSSRIIEIQELVSQCRDGEGGYFAKEMDNFVQNSKEELKFVREEQARVMQVIKRTRDYYQGGASRESAEQSLQLFVIVKDFMGMVDQACVEIARHMQKRKTHKAASYG